MGWLSNLSVGKKIMGGFGILAGLIAIVVVLTTISIRGNEAINQRVFDVRIPTALNTAKAVDGINYSLAALRGWMILGKDKFKDQRADAWRQIRESEAKMAEQSKHWTNSENVRRFEEIQQRLNVFETAQKEVESISRTIDETPASKMLIQQAAPRAAIIVKNISKMIDIETNQPATAVRKRLLGMMADVRGSMGMSLANIRAYLHTGDQAFVNKFNSFWATNNKRYADLSRQTKLFTPGQRSAFNNLRAARAEFAPLPTKMFEIRGNSKWNTANYLLDTKAGPEAGKLLGLLRAMETNQEGLAATDVATAKKAATQLLSSVGMLGVIAIVIAVVISFLISRMITVPVDKAAEGMKYIAQGDLTRKYDVGTTDEMGDMVSDMNAMNNSLVQIVTEVRETSDSIASGASQIAAGNTNLSQRTEEQASSLEETASNMEEMTSTVQQNAESAQEANTLAATAQQQAAKGSEVVDKTITAMKEINASSAKIADIISTIDGIAFQTNLLALNAAVEAARAGEQGRGFAVVASEVRTLAQRSADAAKEIKTLIEDSVEKVKVGSSLVDESGKTLTEINEDINKVANIVAEIASASREQTAGIEQVNTAVTQMDDMTQQNAALVEEAAAASRSMEQQARNLADLMSFFKLASDNDKRTQTHVQSSEVKAAPSTPAKPQAIKRTGTDNKDWENF